MKTTKSESSCNLDNTFLKAIMNNDENAALNYLNNTSRAPISTFLLMPLRSSKLSDIILNLAVKRCCEAMSWADFSATYLNVVKADLVLLNKITAFYLTQESSKDNHR